MEEVVTLGWWVGYGPYTSYRQKVNEWLEVVDGNKNGDGVSGGKIGHNIAIA